MDNQYIPYGRQEISEADIQAVVNVLRSPWLTTGPTVAVFENAVAKHVGTAHAVAVSNGTAALHAAMFAIGIGPGDEVIVPPVTFAATANAVLYQGATPVFADVCPGSLLIDPRQVESKIGARTRAIIAVDYAGQACDYPALQAIARRHNLTLVADACHSLGGSLDGRPCGSLADISVFSFHPVKPITTAEGGMVMTDRLDFADRMRRFRNHGISTDHRQRVSTGVWHYEMIDLGYNYRLSDLQCALGCSQLTRLGEWTARRQQLAARYDVTFAGCPEIRPLEKVAGASHAYHLYVVRVPERERLFVEMREQGIGVNVHYVPVHLHPYYRTHLGTAPGLCPVAEAAYEEVLSLPIFPGLGENQVDRVADALRSAAAGRKPPGRP
jgi:perosamine synthetase